MKVVVVGGWAPSLVSFRGELLREVASRGHEVIAFAADGSPAIAAALAGMGVEFHGLPLERSGLNPVSDGRLLVGLARRLRSIRPDRFFAYNVKPVIYGGMGAAALRVSHRTALVTGLGYPFLDQHKLHRRALKVLVQRLYRTGLAGYHSVVFQNPDDLADAEQLGLVPTGARVLMTNGSGVDLDRFATAPLPDGPPTFLYVGRLVRYKGIFDFVEAARLLRERVPAARCQVVGWLDPHPSSASPAEVERWQRDGTIEYLGETGDVRPFLRAASALVLPSYREGTPRSVLEAMATGRAIVTTDVPGCRETVVPGVTGLLVPVRDPAALAEAMASLAGDRTRLAAMGERGRAFAEEKYDVRKVNAVMLEAMEL
jgi:glycosyltransferase involved in cell wall biosynthesis